MKIRLFIPAALLLLCAAPIWAQPQLGIIPKPESVKTLPGAFELNSKTRIVAADEAGRKMAALLNDFLLQSHGFKLEYRENAPNKKNAIVIESEKSLPETLNSEAYGISVTPDGARLAGRDAGQFYALQSFLQMLPAKIEGQKAMLPAVEITDKPRFRYRGMHLDVGRHFMPVQFVKKYLDMMAQYKFNYFHWHLTEDQGWRIEIKKYPKLTEVGSLRKETVKDRQLNPYVGDGIPHGGFYTQEQVKEVVAYAQARHITVMPEIELPGHSSAALAAYPQLGCNSGYNYQVQTTWGIFKEVFCPKEETFQFLEDVLAEVIPLFPDSPYIHIGGDEVLKDHWKESEFVQQLKQRENLKDENEVQSWFIRRIEKFINAKGKRLVGWDEILEGGLAPNATVMSWRGTRGGIEAAKAKHDVIMTPTDFCYFDYAQGDPRAEPLNIGGYVPLEKVYSFEPVPAELSAEEAKFILGGQANIWTEYMKTPDKVEYMAFPRMMALAEVLWSPAAARDFSNFSARLPEHFARLDKQNVNYRIPEPGGLVNMVLGKNQAAAEIPLNSPLKNGRIFYTVDGSEPSEYSRRYEAPFQLPVALNSKATLKTIVVNERGRKSSVYSATILRRAMLRPSPIAAPNIEGMVYSFFKGAFTNVKDVDRANPERTGETKSFGLRQFNEKENFGVIWDGYLSVPEGGIYEFAVDSDDGAVLVIGEEAVVDNDGIHTRKMATGEVPLEKGFHKMRLKYFQTTGEMNLSVRWGLKHRPLRDIASRSLYH